MTEFDTLKGLRHSEQLVVEHKDTAAVYGSGALEVFATPAMIVLMEKTCLMGVYDKIGEGNTTVGIAVNIKHLKASPVGATIRCEAELIEVDRRRLVFEVKCFEGETLIGEGLHERFVVESEKFMSKFNNPLKKILLICTILLVVLSSCFRKHGRTHHHIETEGYTLTVNGQRIFRDRQLATIPKDTILTFGDTVTLHDDVTSVANQIEGLSQNLRSYSEPGHFKGDYILDLELIHHPGSDHDANASAALANLRDWGYINIDTTDYEKIIVVRKGTSPEDYTIKNTYSYSYSPYEIYVPDELQSDSIDNVALDQWMFGLMDWPLSHPNELLQFLTNHGYDTINAGFSHRQIYPYASRSYKNSGLVNFGGKIAVKSKKTARKITKEIRSL